MASNSNVSVTVQSDPVVVCDTPQIVEVFDAESSIISITVEEDCDEIVIAEDGAQIAIIVDVDESDVVITAIEDELVCVEVGLQGPGGPQGPEGPQGPPGVGIPLTRLRYNEILVGTKNGVNKVFTLPSSEKAIHDVPGVQIALYYNGQRLHPVQSRDGVASDDYSVSESGGTGTGYDTVTFTHIAPKSDDRVSSDYILIP